MSEIEGALNESKYSTNTRNTHEVLVDVYKLSLGLKKTFEGISILFDSLGADAEEMLMPIMGATATAAATATATTAEVAEVTEVTETAEATETSKASTAAIKTENLEKSEQSEQAVKSTEATEITEATEKTEATKAAEAVETAETKSSITLDDITKVIVKKIKQDITNNKKIEEIVHNYGVSKVSQLPESKFEAFMTELANL